MQVIPATPDRNLLAGLLASETPLSVVRLARVGDSVSTAQLPAEQLQQLWADPVLRYSNLLDGLFHQLVILGEAEQDCRFYSAALDAAEKRSSLAVPPADILFVPANGKEGMARLAQALRAVAVPVIAIPDLDILDALQDRGVVAVRVGELEGFAPDLGVAKGKAWLPAALTAGAHEEVDAQSHISRLLEAGLVTVSTGRPSPEPAGAGS